MRYFYARVSTRDQNLDRQLMAAQQVFSGSYDRIFHDKKSGKNFEREGYLEMRSLVKEGDEIVIKDLDRLGRNKEGIKEELKWYREHGVKVRILNVPTTLIECSPDQEWVFDMVNNILIEVLGAIAQTELETTARRIREGLDAMPRDAEGYRYCARTGRRLGGTPKEVPNFPEVYERVKRGEITRQESYAILGICQAKWYKLKKEYEAS